MREVKKGLLKPTLQITALSFIGIILNFLTQLAVAYYFGTTPERDAYFAAMVIPTYVSAILVGSIGVVFLPMYVDIKTKRSEYDANLFLNNTTFFAALIAFVIVVSGILFSREIISATIPGFGNKQIALTSELLIILLPTIVFQIIINLNGSVLQVQHRFILPALVPILFAVINLIGVMAFSKFIGIKSLAYGTLAGTIVMFFILTLYLRKGTDLKFSFNLKNKDISKLIVVCLPLIVAAVIGRVSEVFERGLASTLEAGSISYLGYSKQILVILTTIATSGLATSIFPTMSKAWSDGDIDRVRHYFIKCVQIIFLITIPIAAIFIVLGEPVISIVFERGAFNHKTTESVSTALAVLMGSFLFLSLGSILSKIIYFTQQSYYGLLIGLIEAIVYILSGYYFISLFSFLGLAIASTLSTFITIGVCLMVLLHIKILTKKELTKISTIALLNFTIIIPLSVLLHFTYYVLVKYCSIFFATGIAISIFLFLLMIIYSYVFIEVKQVCQFVMQRIFKQKLYA